MKGASSIASASSGAGSKTEVTSSGSGKINLFENQLTFDYFIANRWFYSSKAIIDLNAENVPSGSKYQTGNLMDSSSTYFTNYNEIKKFNYSINEGKIAAFYNDNSDSIMVLGPLMNSR